MSGRIGQETTGVGLEHIAGPLGEALTRHFSTPDIRNLNQRRPVAPARAQIAAHRLFEATRWAGENLEAA